MAYYRDLREHLAALEREGLLVKIDDPINKDTELMPLVRWQFRGLQEDQRRAFMFTNVVDVKGRHYDIPVFGHCIATDIGVSVDFQTRCAIFSTHSRTSIGMSSQ